MAADLSMMAKRLKMLEDQRAQGWDAHWQDLVSYLLPRRGRWLQKGDRPNYGDPRSGAIIDGLASRCMTMLAAGMQGGLTSPARPWFRLALSDPGLEGSGPVRSWLSSVERVVYHALAKSNFYDSANQMYLEEAGFGTACMLVLDNFPTGVRFQVLTVGEYALGTDHAGVVDTLYRRLWMTARQMVSQFGISAVSDTVARAAGDNPFQWFKVCHGVEPRETRTPGKADNRNMAYSSVYWEDGKTDKPLSESGFAEKPFVAPRWDTVCTDPYGRGPGMDILPDVKMLQEMSKQQLAAVHKMNNPPMAVPVGFKSTLNLTPGGINYVDPGNTEYVRPLYQISPELRDMEVKLASVRQSIKEGLFNDLFLALTDTPPGMTATEVKERHQEKLIMLGPIVERMQMEFLDPLIERCFNILMRHGRLPQPPKELAGQEVKIEYTSLLAQAQREVGTQSITKFVSLVGQIAQIAPSVVDKLNADACVDKIGDSLGVPPEVIATSGEVASTRQARAQAQAQQAMQEQQMQQAALAAKALQQVGSIPTGGGTLASDMLGQTPGQGPEAPQ